MKVTLDLTPAQLESITAQVAFGGTEVDIPEPAPALEEEATFREAYGVNFGTPTNTFDSTLDTEIPFNAGPFRFVFKVGGEVAVDAEVSHWGGFVKVVRVRDELRRWATKENGKWVAKPGYEDIVDRLVGLGFADDDFMVATKGARNATFYPVPYDGRHSTLEMHSARGLELELALNGAMPKEYFIFSLVQAGLYETLKHVFV